MSGWCKADFRTAHGRSIPESCHHLAGLGLDVFEDEGALAVALRNPRGEMPPQAAIVNRILKHPNVLLTPHNAFNSTEALQRKSAKSVEQIRYFFKYRDFLWKV